MATLFALRVMSFAWMALIAALVTTQKLGQKPAVATTITAGVLAALAIGLLVAPDLVPGLVVPGKDTAMHATRMS